MKNNLIEEIRSIFEQSKSWIRLEIEYAKLTLAEKFILLMCSLIIGFICLLFGMVILILLSLALTELFKTIMCTVLAYLSTAGVIIILLAAILCLRKQLIINPISRLITRVFLEKKK